MDEANGKKRLRIRGAVILVLFVSLLTVVGFILGKPAVDLVKDPQKFRAFVDSRKSASGVIFILMMILQMVVAFLPGEPFEIAAGYAFGWFRGLLLVLTATTLGGILIFLFVRRFGRKLVNFFFSEEDLARLKFLHDAKKRDITTFFIFLIPGTPKDLITYFVGLTDMKLSVWLIITSVARFPSVITSVVGGSALGEKNVWFAVAVFAVTAVLSVAGMVVYGSILKKRGETEKGRKGEVGAGDEIEIS